MALLGASDNNLNLKSKYKAIFSPDIIVASLGQNFFPKIDLVASANHGKNIGGLEGTEYRLSKHMFKFHTRF